MLKYKNFSLQGFDPIDEHAEDVSQESSLRLSKLNQSAKSREPFQPNSLNKKEPFTNAKIRDRTNPIVGKENKENIDLNRNKQPKFVEDQKRRRHKEEQEDANLSGLSGFSASDDEENESFELAQKHQSQSDNQEEEEDDMHAQDSEDLDQFDEHDGEEEDQELENELQKEELYLAQQLERAKMKQLERPHTASSRHNMNQYRNNIDIERSNPKAVISRPQTANFEGTPQRLDRPQTASSNASFKPVYKVGYQEFLIQKKVFNYKEKKFSTVPKKTDVVSRINAYKSTWKSTSFLKGNSLGTKEGRKLNLAERNYMTRPDAVYYKYGQRSVKSNF